MPKPLLIALACAVYLALVPAASLSAKESRVESDALAALNRKVAAWNNHDLDQVLNAYLNSPNLIIVSSSGNEVSGYDALKLRYQKIFGTNRESMGKVAVTDYKISALGKRSALCTGHYRLEEPNHPLNHGAFTLVYGSSRKDGCKIIHEHLSRDPELPRAGS